jgi:orotidine-5'-phosphate decarboxylase
LPLDGEPVPAGGEPAAPGLDFGARIARCVVTRESQIVLGLDPDPGRLWPGSDRDGGDGPPAVRAAAAVEAHCRALIDAAGQACVAVKAQLACFERLGEPGRRALAGTLEYAREQGLLSIADGKRGDIDVSAAAYAQALFGGLSTPFGPIEGLGVDMATANPLMGADALRPFVDAARACGAGVLVLVRTSNPGAADVEDLRLAGGGTVWERIAKLVDRLGEGASSGDEGQSSGGEGPSSAVAGIADVGAVMGATAPGHLLRARELMPRALFLLPGVGAQGGRVEDLSPAFAPGRAGALVSASRSIANAHLQRGGSPAAAARAEAERLREAAWRLSER